MLVCVVCGESIGDLEPYQTGLGDETAHVACSEILEPEDEEDFYGDRD